MVNIITLNQKGGVGKSMLADEIAFSFERTGEALAFYDLDSQGGTLHETSPAETMSEASVAVIDTPGALQKDLDAWLNEADVVVIPTRTSHREIEPLTRMISALDRHPGKKVLFVLNEYNRFRVSATFREWLKSIRDERTILTLKHFEQIDQAGLNSMSVVEYAPGSKAARETLAVVNEIRRAAGFPEEELKSRKRNAEV